MTSPAQELRTAAATLRALLADRQLTPGPWLSMDRGDRVLWDGEGAEDQPPVYVVDEPMSNGANADYIAVMHPDVAREFADLLTAAADMAAEYPDLARDHDRPACDDYACGVMGHALAVARAILGPTRNGDNT